MAPIELSVHKNIATITLNIPEKLNALDREHYTLLGSLMRQVAEMPEVTITILTGTGRYFSAGADAASAAAAAPQTEAGGAGREAQRQFYLGHFAAGNIDLTRAFLVHPKILVAALNGPAVGLSAALVGLADFVYATPETFILTPFTSLGLVAEGGASHTFVRRMGIAKANEALIQSRPIPCDELVQCGFVNKVFEREGFAESVRAYVEDAFGAHLDADSLIVSKRLIRESQDREIEAANVREAACGVERFAAGIPQRQFARIVSGQKRHKL